MSNINERLAVVETQVDQILDDGHQRERTQNEILAELRETKDVLYELQNEIMRYKGFFGGIIFVGSCLGALVIKFGLPVYNLIMKAKGNG